MKRVAMTRERQRALPTILDAAQRLLALHEAEGVRGFTGERTLRTALEAFREN